MPQTVRLTLWAMLTLLIGGAIYLMIVRGPVMLLDLANGVVGFLCL